ncbi:hypothetical protein ON010_g15956 [Phytophthora cinnamomi]|nr:hypothetical protein ON010_g15956 [Phytophthora cinnamomi]
MDWSISWFTNTWQVLVRAPGLSRARRPSITAFFPPAKHGQVCTDAQSPEVAERRTARTAHQLNELVRELERCPLEVPVAARAVGEQEAKVDVDHMTVRVHQDVAVVAILDLENVADDRIGCKAFDKVSLCSSKARGFLFTMKTGVEVPKVIT